MVVKHCVYKDCESDSRYWDRDYMNGVCFIRFPDPISHRQRCQKWVKACDRQELTIGCVDDKTYICSKHFIGGNGPTKEHSDPLSPLQLLAANRLNQNMNSLKSLEILSETEDNFFFKSNNNLNFDINSTQTNETDFITNLLNKNHSLISETQNENKISTNFLDKSIINESLITSSLTNDQKVVDIDSSDNSIDYSNDLMSDSLFMPNITSNLPQITSQLLPKETQNNENNKSSQEVVNNSLPLIIIPSNNQMIGSSFTVPVLPLNDDKIWFKQIINNDFCLKLCYYGLSFGRIGQRLTFSSIEGSVVAKQLIVDISGHFDVKVFGLSISAKNEFYKLVPNIIQNELEFNSIINLFSKWKVCIANEITDQVFEDKIIAIRAFVCNITNTIRSRNCDLFLPEIGSIRCKSCRILLNRIRKFKYNSNIVNK